MIRLAIAAALAAAGTHPVPPTDDAFALFDLINSTRAVAGVAEVQHSADLAQVAQAWADEMASGRAAYGHNPDYFDQIPRGWAAAAENVAWRSNGDLIAMHMQWIESQDHYENMLRPWTHAGTGYAKGSDNRWYGVQVYAYYPREVALVERVAHDLAVTVDPPGGDLAPGEEGELEVQVTNTSDRIAPAHRVSVYAPPGITIDGQSEFHHDYDTPLWQGESYSLHVPFRLDDTLQADAVLYLVVELAKNSGDSNPTNDSATAVVAVVPIELEIDEADDEVDDESGESAEDDEAEAESDEDEAASDSNGDDTENSIGEAGDRGDASTDDIPDTAKDEPALAVGGDRPGPVVVTPLVQGGDTAGQAHIDTERGTGHTQPDAAPAIPLQRTEPDTPRQPAAPPAAPGAELAPEEPTPLQPAEQQEPTPSHRRTTGRAEPRDATDHPGRDHRSRGRGALGRVAALAAYMAGMSTSQPRRAKTTAVSTAGSFAPKSQSAPETALGGEFVFDKNYSNLAQVEPFYESYLARRAELEAAGRGPYNESFCGHIEGLSGPNENTAIYLLQVLHERNQNERAAEEFVADGGVEIDTSIQQTHRGVVARRGWYSGGTGWEVLGEGRLVVDEHGRATFIAKGRRLGVLKAGTLYVKPV